mmetsp:Transcript_17184/g.42296  ORF Transcript_17184/g.42296 Transcript_17184/m.42296 type:complete len:81 (+) Transcript_17184:1694-1936(+)
MSPPRQCGCKLTTIQQATAPSDSLWGATLYSASGYARTARREVVLELGVLPAIVPAHDSRAPHATENTSFSNTSFGTALA